MKRVRGVLATAAIGAAFVAVPAAVPAATPAFAAQSTQSFACGSTQISIRVADNNSSDNGGWGAAQVVAGGSGTLIPTSFAMEALDTTANSVLFSFDQQKGNGNANHNQQAITCTQSTSGTLQDLIDEMGPPPGGQLPPGTSLSDNVTVTFTVTAVPKP